MRVLLSTYGSRGDVGPVAGLAAALRGLGAEAVVCAPPDEEFAALVEGVGATFVPTGLPAREMVSGVRPGSKADAQRVADGLVTMRIGMLTVARECDAVVAAGLFPAGAREVAEHFGVPYVFAAYVPTVLPSPHHAPMGIPGRPYPPDADNPTLWAIDAENANALYGGPLNARRAELGLPPVDDVRRHVYTDRPWLASDPVLAPWRPTPELDVVQTGAWTLPDERPLGADAEAFLDAGEPPVYVGFGSMPPHVLKGTAEAAVEAVRVHGRRLLVSRGWADLGPTGADDFVIGEADHRALFTRVAAVVHHGGAGTTLTAARSGAPQVVVPQIGDQPYWADRVASLGIGAAHHGPPSTESMSDALETALSPQTGDRAAAVAAEIRTDGAERAAGLLLETIG